MHLMKYFNDCFSTVDFFLIFIFCLESQRVETIKKLSILSKAIVTIDHTQQEQQMVSLFQRTPYPKIQIGLE